MSELLWPLAAVVLTVLLGAWREYANGNRRDAALLAAEAHWDWQREVLQPLA